jgi:hypothetical protein
MRSKRKRAKQRSRSVCLPPEDSLEAERRQLPFFEPYETSRLQIAAGYALTLRLRRGYMQSLWNISARDLTLTTPRIAW